MGRHEENICVALNYNARRREYSKNAYALLCDLYMLETSSWRAV